MTGASSDGGISVRRWGCVTSSKMVGERQSMETFVEVCVVCVGSISSLFGTTCGREAPNPPASLWSAIHRRTVSFSKIFSSHSSDSRYDKQCSSWSSNESLWLE